MIECATLQEALAVPGVIHVIAEPDGTAKAYLAGDELPSHARPPPPSKGARSVAEKLAAADISLPELKAALDGLSK